MRCKYCGKETEAEVCEDCTNLSEDELEER